MLSSCSDIGLHGLRRKSLIERAQSLKSPNDNHDWFSEYLCLHLMEVLWWEFEEEPPSETGIWVVSTTPKQVKLIENFPIAKCYQPVNQNDEILKEKYNSFLASIRPIDRTFIPGTAITADSKYYMAMGLYTFFLDRNHQFLIAYSVDGEKKVRKKIAFPTDSKDLFGKDLPPKPSSKMTSQFRRDLEICRKSPDHCVVCGKPTTTKCQRQCEMVLYCSNKCRKSDYRKHRCRDFIPDRSNDLD